MKRGEIWTVADGSSDTRKPRPAVIVQADAFAATDSITVCAFTSDPTEAPLLRVLVQPSGNNGLTAPCRLMVDKLISVASGASDAPFTNAPRGYVNGVRPRIPRATSRRPTRERGAPSATVVASGASTNVGGVLAAKIPRGTDAGRSHS